MIETRDLGLLEETELIVRAKAKPSYRDVGRSLKNIERILETADLPLEGQRAIPELIVRAKDADPAVRFWGVMGLVSVSLSAGPETMSVIEPVLEAALGDDAVSVRLTAAEGLCNLGRYADAAPVLAEALAYPVPAARIRAACILDSQPPEANADLQGAIGALQQAAARTDVRGLPGIPYGLNDPFGRALKAIQGEASYYRWGMGASGSPKNPLIEVQE
jgi:hypothetical protein